jgi:hypothetical protein
MSCAVDWYAGGRTPAARGLRAGGGGGGRRQSRGGRCGGKGVRVARGERRKRGTALKKLRDRVLKGLFVTGRHELVLERWTNPTLSRRSCRAQLRATMCRGKSAGVASEV